MTITMTTRKTPEIVEYDSSSDLDEMPTSANERSLRELLGLEDIGLALFSPISDELLPLRPCLNEQLAEYDKDDYTSDSSPRDVFFGDLHHSLSPKNEEEFDSQRRPVQIEPPHDPTELLYAPPILSEEMLQQVVDEALPSNLQMYSTWKRLFSINLHGDCVSTMLNQCKSFRHTMIVLKTSQGTLLGGFASEPWKVRAGFNKCSYYGTGASFLFSDYPGEPGRRFSFYKWVGANDYCQLCDTDTGRIALGGGGNFGLVIEDNFLKGSTGPCDTFDNPSLVPGFDGTFDILEFEVYGIVPLMQTSHFRAQ